MSPPSQTKTPTLHRIYDRLLAHFGPQDWWPGRTPFEIAVGAILTQNTNWVNVEKAIGNLRSQRVLSARAIRSLPEKRLAELIRPSGYFRQKARRLKIFVDFLFSRYRGGLAAMKQEPVDRLRENLLSVEGIGPETADSILLYAVEKPIFVIDTYTTRVLARHGLIASGASYATVQALFHQQFVPQVPLFNEFHALFVQVGKKYCRPKPRCADCPLNDNPE